MITIITERPFRSINIQGYGVDSYTDKSGKKIYRVYGIVEPGSHGRIIGRNHDDVKDFYTDDYNIVIFRNEDKGKAMACKNMIDVHVANGAPIFIVEEFKQWLQHPENLVVRDAKVEQVAEQNVTDAEFTEKQVENTEEK